MGSGAGSKYASAFSAVPEGRLYLQASGTSCNRPRHRRAGGEAARSSPWTVIRWNPETAPADSVFFGRPNHCDFEISSDSPPVL